MKPKFVIFKFLLVFTAHFLGLANTYAQECLSAKGGESVYKLETFSFNDNVRDVVKKQIDELCLNDSIRILTDKELIDFNIFAESLIKDMTGFLEFLERTDIDSLAKFSELDGIVGIFICENVLINNTDKKVYPVKDFFKWLIKSNSSGNSLKWIEIVSLGKIMHPTEGKTLVVREYFSPGNQRIKNSEKLHNRKVAMFLVLNFNSSNPDNFLTVKIGDMSLSI